MTIPAFVERFCEKNFGKAGHGGCAAFATTRPDFFKHFESSPEIIRFPLSLRNLKDLLHKRGIDVSPENFHQCAY